jgi:outer membrane receptor protein involved in Fe transport
VHTVINEGRSRYMGIESLAALQISNRWRVGMNYTFLSGRDLNPVRNIRRLPPQEGGFRIWYTPSGRRPWFLINSRFTGPQLRLNGADIDDDRIGASRRRSDIVSFFRAGVVSPFISGGTDGRLGTADDIFAPTSETSLQIQNRVLPIGATINGVRITNDGTRVPLYLKTSGWWTLDLQAGMPLSEHLNVQSGITNVFDRNYRVHGSGVDASGLNVYLGVRYVF